MSLNRTLQRLGLAALALGLTAGPAAASPFWFVDTVTPWGHKVDFLYQFMMWISVAILVVVEVALVAALIKFRKKPGENRQPETWSHNTKLEVIWTVIPFGLLIAILVPTFQALAYLADVPKNPDLTLEVVGHQFYWEYRYPDLNVTFNSSPRDANGGYGEPLVMPVGKKLKVILTASDVIHGWWVPAFGIQQMTTPGNLAMIPLEIEKAGDYTGNCAYLCGPQHGAMGIFVRAVDQPAFLAWANQHKSSTGLKPIATVGQVGQTPPPPEANEVPEGKEHEQKEASAAKPSGEEAKELAAKGKDVYAAKCLGCHQPTGAGVPGVFPPLDGSEFVTGDPKQLVKIITGGKSGPIKVKGTDFNSAMPPIGATMSDEEVAEVATYIRSTWSNKADAVGPGQVKAAK